MPTDLIINFNFHPRFSHIRTRSMFEKRMIPSLADVANPSTKYFLLSKVYAVEGGLKYVYHSLSVCAGANPRAKARGLSPRTDWQTVVYLLLTVLENTVNS